MIILTIRTDKPEAEIGLFDDQKELAYESWHAHRALAESLHTRIHELLEGQHKDFKDVQGIVGYKGPGSFTGLRIGLTVANALASGLGASLVTATGEQWRETAIDRLLSGENEELGMPEYGADVHITLPKH